MQPWVRRQWVAWSLGAAVLVGVTTGLRIGDARAGTVALAGSAVAFLVAWRPGGVVERTLARTEEREQGVRPGCALAMGAVLVAVVGAAVAGWALMG